MLADADPELANPRWGVDGRRRPGRAGIAAALLAGALLASGLVMQRTAALFGASTGNPANAFGTGTVSLGDDDSGAALFSANSLVAGATATRCIVVTYGGSVGASVRFYVPSATGSLASALDMVVEEGTGGSASTCSGFSGTQLFSGTLAALAATATNFGTGLGTFAPTGTGQSRTYRITYTVQAGAPTGATATAILQWEAQS